MQLRLYILTLHHVAMSSCSYLLLVLPFSLCFPRPLVPTLVYVCLSWKVCISLFCDIHTLLFFFVFLHPLSAVSHILSLRLFYLAPYTHLVISLILTNSSQTPHLFYLTLFSTLPSSCVFICSVGLCFHLFCRFVFSFVQVGLIPFTEGHKIMHTHTNTHMHSKHIHDAVKPHEQPHRQSLSTVVLVI